MPKTQNPKRSTAREIYNKHKGAIALTDIAKQLGVPEGTVRGWKNKDNWGDGTTVGTERGSERSKRNTERSKRSGDNKARPLNTDKKVADAAEENTELTPQQREFCVFFIRNHNATQSYLKAYKCSYDTANTAGPRLLVNVRIQSELKRLRDIKNEALGYLCGDDIVELHMRIAFADMTEYVEFGTYNRPVLNDGVPVMVEHPVTKEKVMLTRPSSEVRLKNSDAVDGQLITEVSEGRDGIKIKRADQQRSLAFLERYFGLNPMDRHRREYDQRRLDIELTKLEVAQQTQSDESSGTSSNFLEAMNSAAGDIWVGYDKPDDVPEGG